MKTELQVHAIPAFADNYIWLMHDGSNAVVIDPGASEPVEKALAEMGLSSRRDRAHASALRPHLGRAGFA